MKGFEHDVFFMYQINTNDLRPGDPPSSYQSNLSDLSTSDVIATSSITNIMNGVVDDQFLVDLNVENGIGAENNVIIDDNRFINLPNRSTSQGPFSSESNAEPASSLAASGELDSFEVPEFSPDDLVLGYISQILMEENMDEKFDVYPEHPDLLAAEKPFYEILGETSSLSPDQNSSNDSESSNSTISNHHGHSSGSNTNGMLANNSWPYDPLEYSQLQTNPISLDYSSQSSSLFSNRVGNVNGVLQESLLDSLVPDTPAWQFQKGLEEARKFLPSDDKLMIGGFQLPQEPREERKLIEINAKNVNRENLVHESRGTKTQHDDDLYLQEGRSNKQRALSTMESVPTEIFDAVLQYDWYTCTTGNEDKAELQNGAGKISLSNKSKGSGGGKGRRKMQPKKEVVDLTTLLIHCAQAVTTNDRRSANELLKQIKHHSSPYGDGNQRLAHCFAEGLEARLAGTGSEIYRSIVAKPITVADMLKAYKAYMCACPFKKVSYFFSNMTILNLAKNATKLHIIDFGIYHGFQWPCLLKRLAVRPEGPPRLRITGIDIPRPGFRPTERVDDTGRRLAEYARRYDIPFEFHPIAAKWETIKAEDLNIDKDELLVVNSLFQFNILMDETATEDDDSPRNMVLKTIRDLNPAVFILGIVNGTYNSPFFLTRFREALFHFSSLFDVIEENVAREDDSRLLIERNILGRDALNVIACEGSERVERPETYKQWQVRNRRAGFRQLRLTPDITDMAKEKLKAYHKEFVGDVDGQWLLEGWKGRISFALSTWKSNDSY
ncbi:hypothetical protein Cni_G29160 [Canna indica]|uniref:Scarecrow-like protein 14 n=1 Tax=Canna indica TaxID=4628 RepID=A0AAQ3QTR3_9LILI|nr:hypothetical protein Cni_G29160 [Canna indica]